MASLQAGKPPIGPAVDGMFLMIAGFLLLTPGFIADGLGLVLLVPPVRRAIAAWSIRRLLRSAQVRTTIFGDDAGREARRARARADHARGSGAAPPTPQQGPIIDGEFERLDERPAGKTGGQRPLP